MKYRHLGASGLRISEITFGNWLTHGSQLANDAATACVHAALDAGITTFDTADMYANTAAESVLGEALQGPAARVARDLHEGLLRDRTRGSQRLGTVAQAPHGVDRRLAATARHRLRRPLPGASLGLRHAAGGDDGRVRRHRPQRQGALHRGQRVERRAAARRRRAREGAAHPVRVEPAAVLGALAGHRSRGRARLARARDLADRLVACRAGRADRQVPPRTRRSGGEPCPRREASAATSTTGGCGRTCSPACSSSCRSPTSCR